ncbi:MAG: TusE/DsrC/DsvC family sulfur relay protein [Candidatus Bathyarchaeia archaeon]
MEFKRAIIEYVKEFYREYNTAPSIRQIISRFESEELNRSKLYERFPGGLAEICRLAGIPAPERLARTRRALEAKMRAKERKDGGATSSMRLVLTEEQTKRLLAISHLEGKDELTVMDELLNFDFKLRKYGLSMEKIKRFSDAVDMAVGRGWKINHDPSFVDAVTKAYNLGMLHLPPETLKLSVEVFDWARKKGWSAFEFADYVTRHHNELMIYMRYVKGEISYEEFKRSVEPYVQN